MDETEAIRRANAFLLADRGIEATPVQTVYRHSDRPYWIVRYGTAILFPKETAAGCTIDDGDYILEVDDTSGVVSLFD